MERKGSLSAIGTGIENRKSRGNALIVKATIAEFSFLHFPFLSQHVYFPAV
jgi:hypothetical protein